MAPTSALTISRVPPCRSPISSSTSRTSGGAVKTSRNFCRNVEGQAPRRFHRCTLNLFRLRSLAGRVELAEGEHHERLACHRIPQGQVSADSTHFSRGGNDDGYRQS